MVPIRANNKEETILVIIVTYNAERWLEELMAPFTTDREGLDILVVDNGSSDGTTQLIQDRYPFVTLWARPSNLGFGAANNLGLEWALAYRYKGVFLLNQDASITATSIRALGDFAEQNEQVGILSPLHLNREGGVEHGFSHYIYGVSAEDEGFRSLPFINAALWYLPLRTIAKVGLFSPLFTHYGEDLDYAHRVRSHQLQVGYLPSVQGYHYREEQSYTDEETYYRTLRLKRAYHLVQLVNPLLRSSFRHLWEGPLKLWANSWQAWWKGDKRLAKDLRRAAKELWSMRGEAKLWRAAPAPDPIALLRTIEREDLAPVLLIVYNRPKHTERILGYFAAQPEAPRTHLYILSDGAKDNLRDKELVAETRTICRAFAQKHPHTTLWEQSANVGLARNVTEGVSRVLEVSEKVIVLEDDLKLSPYFLRWMNDHLELQRDQKEIAHLHGGTFYSHPKLHNNHLLSFIGCWGWATWRDRWQTYWEADGKKLLSEIEAKPDLKRYFDYGGYMKFTRMLRHQTVGKNNSWAIRWHASLLLAGKLSINAYPALVCNDGFDGTGTHAHNDNRYHTPISPYPLNAAPLKEPIVESVTARSILLRYYRRTNNKVAKGYFKLREWWRQWRRRSR